MKTSERDREKAALKAAQVWPVPLEQDLLIEIELLKIKLDRVRYRAWALNRTVRRLRLSRDTWRHRALRGRK